MTTADIIQRLRTLTNAFKMPVPDAVEPIADLKKLFTAEVLDTNAVANTLEQIKNAYTTYILNWGGMMGSKPQQPILVDRDNVALMQVLIREMLLAAERVEHLDTQVRAMTATASETQVSHKAELTAKDEAYALALAQHKVELTAKDETHVLALAEQKAEFERSLAALKETHATSLAAAEQKFSTELERARQELEAEKATARDLRTLLDTTKQAFFEDLRKVKDEQLQEERRRNDQLVSTVQSNAAELKETRKSLAGFRQSISTWGRMSGSASFSPASAADDEAPTYKALKAKLKNYLGETKIQCLARLEQIFEHLTTDSNRQAVVELMALLYTNPGASIESLIKQVAGFPSQVTLEILNNETIGSQIKEYINDEDDDEDATLLRTIQNQLTSAKRQDDPHQYRQVKLGEILQGMLRGQNIGPLFTNVNLKAQFEARVSEMRSTSTLSATPQ